MSKRALKAGMKMFPKKIIGTEETMFGPRQVDANEPKRVCFMTGYMQAEKETIERACKLLYDFNKQMTSMFGPKAFLSCNQYTIDVDRFRKILEMEEE